MPDLRFAFKRVPRLGEGWRYVPLHRIPEKTVLNVYTAPMEGFRFAELKESNERDSILIVESQIFTLETGIYPTFYCRGLGRIPDQSPIKPYTSLLAPSSTLRANVELFERTFVLETGPITKIEVFWQGNCRYILKKSDLTAPDEYEIIQANREWALERMAQVQGDKNG